MDPKPNRTPRLFVAPPLGANESVLLDEAQSHYLGNVMRLKTGNRVLLFNGRDGEWLATVVELGRRGARLDVDRRTRAQSRGPDIHYLFAPLKRSRLDYIVQKATELGASRIQPVFTNRTNVSRVKPERMRANAIEAAEQCDTLQVPEIGEAEPLSRVLDAWDARRRLIFCDEAAEPNSPVAALNVLPAGPAALLLGPEGGFDPSERERLLSLPFTTAISLGPRTMRADTAGTAALALAQAVLGDWR